MEMKEERKYATYSYDEYTGCKNIEIGLLKIEILIAYSKIKSMEKEIDAIQDVCIHEYKFTSRGPYDDNYACCLCGHETEH